MRLRELFWFRYAQSYISMLVKSMTALEVAKMNTGIARSIYLYEKAIDRV